MSDNYLVQIVSPDNDNLFEPVILPGLSDECESFVSKSDAMLAVKYLKMCDRMNGGSLYKYRVIKQNIIEEVVYEC